MFFWVTITIRTHRHQNEQLVLKSLVVSKKIKQPAPCLATLLRKPPALLMLVSNRCVMVQLERWIHRPRLWHVLGLRLCLLPLVTLCLLAMMQVLGHPLQLWKRGLLLPPSLVQVLICPRPPSLVLLICSRLRSGSCCFVIN